MHCPTCEHKNPHCVLSCGICGQSLTSGETNQVVSATIQQLPTVNFFHAIRSGYKKYFQFNGRVRRSEFWWFVLFTLLLVSLTWIPFIGWPIGIVIVIPSLAVISRRLHDIGKSGWWQLCFGLIIFLLSILFIASIIFAINFADNNNKMVAVIFVLCGLISIFVAITTMIQWIIWLSKEGDTGPNKYGPDPKNSIAEQTE